MYKKLTQLARTQYLNVDEVALLVSAPNRNTLLGIRDYAIIKTFLNTGLRRQELIDLKVGDLRSDDKGWYLLVQSKGGNEDEQAIQSESTISAIRKYLNKRGEKVEPKDPLFRAVRKNTKAGNRKISRTALTSMLKKYAKRAGILKKITCHTLRHTFGTEYYSATKDLVITQKAMRHRSVSSTMVYVHADDSRVRQGLGRVNF